MLFRKGVLYPLNREMRRYTRKISVTQEFTEIANKECLYATIVCFPLKIDADTNVGIYIEASGSVSFFRNRAVIIGQGKCGSHANAKHHTIG